jgi:hypothetical protein
MAKQKEAKRHRARTDLEHYLIEIVRELPEREQIGAWNLADFLWRKTHERPRAAT